VGGKPEDFFVLEEKVAGDLAQAIARLEPLAPVAPVAPAGPKAKPRRLAAKTAALYGAALEAIDQKDVETAKQTLKDVLKQQPDFALASRELAALVR